MAGFGAYGKIPALGDFFRIGVAPAFVEVWDGWLQSGVVALRDALGDRWQSCYLSAPIWRFSLATKVVGTDPMVGVVMPSVDRVGRQFPLTLAAPVPDGGSALKMHLAAASLFAELEEIALDALDDAMTRDKLAERLLPLVPVPGSRGTRMVVARDTGLVAVTSTGQPSDPPPGVAELASEMAVTGFRRPCIWSAALDGGTRMLITEGLPAMTQISALFDLHAPPWPVVRSQGAMA